MTIFSWNVNGIRANISKGEFAKFINAYKPDILCLQETKAKQGQAEIDLPEYEEYWNDADRPGYSGTAIFSKIEPLEVHFGFSENINRKYNFQDQFGDASREGRVTALEFDKFFLVTQYTPNAKPNLERLSFREKIWDPAFLEYVKQLEQSKPVIFCGDLNVAHAEMDLARPKDNVGKTGFTKEERSGFQNYIDSGFVDTFRKFYPDESGAYTWWTWRANARARNVGWRIDYFLTSGTIIDKIDSAQIHPEQFGSDHCPVSVNLKEEKL
jgi:exodeoxyribonuclease III